jgi:hypothetical protein
MAQPLNFDALEYPPYRCPDCANRFYTLQELIIHAYARENHHYDHLLVPYSKEIKIYSDNFKFVCNTCNLRFYKEASMLKHTTNEFAHNELQ